MDMAKIVFLITGILAVLAITVIAIFSYTKILVFPAFFLPKSSQQILQGDKCNGLKELWQRNMCYSSSAADKRDSSLCEQIIVSEKDETSGQNKKLCYKNVAVRTKNSSLCYLAGEYQGECELESNR